MSRADDWAERTRRLLLNLEYSAAERRTDIFQQIIALREEILEFINEPLPITFFDKSAFDALYDQTMASLEQVERVLYYNHLLAVNPR